MEPVGWKPEMRLARGAAGALIARALVADAPAGVALVAVACVPGAVRAVVVVIVVMSMLLDSGDRPIESRDMRRAHENGRPNRTAA